jgi:hypothetical protein
MSLKPIPIIFKEISDAKTHLEKVKVLKNNRNSMVDLLLELAFSKNLKINLPDGEPPYIKTGEADLFNATLLYANRKSIELFINENTMHIPQVKREQLFIDLLENLDINEAKLLCEVKDKNLISYPGIKKKVIEKVYPQWELI